MAGEPIVKIGPVLSGASQPQSGNLTVTPEVSSAPGDLILVFCSVADSASASYSMSGGTGTWTTQLATTSVGTGKMFIFTKPFAAGDTTYTLARTGSDAYRIATLTIQGWDGNAPLIGAYGTRAASGGTFNTTAPSITTSVADSLVLYLAYERTNANDNAPTVNNGFTTVLDVHTIGSDNLQAVYIAGKAMTTPGAVGATTATFSNSSASNSAAVLMAFGPSGDLPPITTGQIGIRVPTSVTSTSVTMGVDRKGGTDVEIAAKLGATEVARLPVTIDAASGWGNATFTGLDPDSFYGFEFYVDDALQTDTEALIRTHPTPGTPTDFVYVAGSCQFTGSNHPVWDRILEENARGLGHMGDQNYADATNLANWRIGVESSFTAPRMRAMLGLLPITWTWDNHDRIILDDGGAGSGLNFGRTDPATLTNWRHLAGSSGWASSDTGGRTWVIGRVRFIQTDNWTAKTDPDAGIVPPNEQTFLGALQKQWFKDTLEAATEPLIVWLCQWTTAETGSGRWNSYNAETDELEAFINARPGVKARLVMIGGDSHSVQATDGSRTGGNFDGVPSLNISGFNRSSDSGQGGGGWDYDGPLRTSAQPEADWGGYSRMTFTDDGSTVGLLWEAVRVGPTGTTDVMTSQTFAFPADAEGAAAGSVTWAGSATGKRAPVGSASGGVLWAGSASGEKDPEGASNGGWQVAGAAQGASERRGAAAGAVQWSGSAQGVSQPLGEASGGVSWAGTASGGAGAGGIASGGTLWSGSAAGEHASAGLASGGAAWSGSAGGTIPSEGAASGQIGWAGLAEGKTKHSGTAGEGAWWSGTATGTIERGGTAAGGYEFGGLAVGEDPEPPAQKFPPRMSLVGWSRSFILVSEDS